MKIVRNCGNPENRERGVQVVKTVRNCENCGSGVAHPDPEQCINNLDFATEKKNPVNRPG